MPSFAHSSAALEALWQAVLLARVREDALTARWSEDAAGLRLVVPLDLGEDFRLRYRARQELRERYGILAP